MAELIDIGSLAEPITKLIEVVSEGIGGALRPWQTRRVARADADAKLIHAEADQRVTISAAETEIVVAFLREDGQPDRARRITQVAPMAISPIEERAMTRLLLEEGRAQSNLERVVRQAASKLPPEVSDEPVDPDWTARLVRHVKEVSNPAMQALWAEVLAREVAKPGQFSLDTLDVLANLTQREARLFERLVQVRLDDWILLPRHHQHGAADWLSARKLQGERLEDHLGVGVSDMLRLIHHRLVEPTPRPKHWPYAELTQSNWKLVFSCVGGALEISAQALGAANGDLDRQTIGLTPAGVEIASIINAQMSQDTFARWVSYLESHGATAKSTLTYLVNGEPRYSHTWTPTP